MGAAREAKVRFLIPISEPAQRTEVARRAPQAERRLSFCYVPTYAIGYSSERRRCPRAGLNLPLRLTCVAGQAEPVAVTLVTRNISATGVYFLAPRRMDPETPIELEVALVERPLGQGSVRMATAAHIVRTEETCTPGWRGYAASFDDISFLRDEIVPERNELS